MTPNWRLLGALRLYELADLTELQFVANLGFEYALGDNRCFPSGLLSARDGTSGCRI